MLHGMAMVYISMEVRRRKLSNSQLEALLRAIRTDADNNTRLLGVTILEWQRYPDLEAILRELAGDKSPQVAFEANFRLAKLGYDTADAMLRSIPFLTHLGYEIRHVMAMKAKLRLTPEQQAKAMKLMVREATKTRHGFWRFPDAPAARALHEFLELGVPPEDDDIDNIARAIFTYRESRWMHNTGRRREMVKYVAWFANDRARDWLRTLSNSEALPKNVRAAARRELRTLEASTRRG
jgi:hypothetical protein